MSRPSLARLATVALIALTTSLTTLVTAPAAAAADLPTPTFSGGAGSPSALFTLSGTGCVDQPDQPRPGIIITSPTRPEIGTGGEAQANGSWSIPTRFSPDVPFGNYTLKVTCNFYVAEPVAYPDITLTVAASGVTVATATPSPTACADCTKIAAGDTVSIGEVVVLKLSGYKPHEWVTVTMRSTPVELGRFQADAAGVVNIRFTVPRNGSVGSSHTLTFSGSLGTPDLV